ncbi:prohibitin family protein [Oxynema sp. CENA135]|uniref:prohibitin family protein n=1 Tax=Oxynema sp. CENA135 TaxID=984206 RepID=UPI00190D8DFF|nr:prohibitin family protein [Oxynema sp. CENA135]MBK4731080.1 prohibitin family protein [Oxynema sp. CENA135]
MTFIATTLTTLISILVVLVGPKMAEEKYRTPIRAIALLVGLVAAAASVFKTLAIVPAGKVGVVEVFGTVMPRALGPGVHPVNPLGKVVQFSTRLRDIKETVTATSQEGLSLSIDVSLQYKLDPTTAPDVYQEIGKDETDILISRFRAIIREIVAAYDARSIYTDKRQEIAQRLRQEMRASLTPLGFEVETALLRDVALPENLQAAIEEKLQAEQESQRMEFVLQKERQEAERKKIEAQGIADFQSIVSQGLTSQFLQWKSIEATQNLANSNNSKVVIMGGGVSDSGTPPVILQP